MRSRRALRVSGVRRLAPRYGYRTVMWAGSPAAAAASIDADPNAEAFYLAMGAVRIGQTPSGSIPGRVLPWPHGPLH
jgi:hypothetical protein